MSFSGQLCVLLIVAFSCSWPPVKSRSYNTGLIFYDLRSHLPYLPPTVSVSRGRALAGFKYSSKGSIWSTFGQPCECSGALCGCCAGLKVKQYKFDQKICANITFVPQREEAQLEVFLNEESSAKYGVSARNPSPFCIPIMMGVPMAMCVQMSDIAVQGNNLNMCMDFKVRLATTDLFEMHFQCMRMGLDGIQYVDRNGNPVIPPIISKTDNNIATLHPTDESESLEHDDVQGENENHETAVNDPEETPSHSDAEGVLNEAEEGNDSEAGVSIDQEPELEQVKRNEEKAQDSHEREDEEDTVEFNEIRDKSENTDSVDQPLGEEFYSNKEDELSGSEESAEYHDRKEERENPANTESESSLSLETPAPPLQETTENEIVPVVQPTFAATLSPTVTMFNVKDAYVDSATSTTAAADRVNDVEESKENAENDRRTESINDHDNGENVDDVVDDEEDEEDAAAAETERDYVDYETIEEDTYDKSPPSDATDQSDDADEELNEDDEDYSDQTEKNNDANGDDDDDVGDKASNESESSELKETATEPEAEATSSGLNAPHTTSPAEAVINIDATNIKPSRRSKLISYFRYSYGGNA